MCLTQRGSADATVCGPRQFRSDHKTLGDAVHDAGVPALQAPSPQRLRVERGVALNNDYNISFSRQG